MSRAVRDAAGNPGLSPTDNRLLDLCDSGLLEHYVAERIRTLVLADSMAHRVEDLVDRADRAEAVAAEAKRQMQAAHRQVDRLRDEMALLQRRANRQEVSR